MPIQKGTTYSTGQQVTAANLNNLVDDATFTASSVDNVTTQLSGGAIIVKDGGISSGKLAALSVTEDKIATSAVSLGKIASIANDTILGNASGSSAAPSAITCTAAGRALLDDASASDQRSTLGLGSLSTQASSSVSITGGAISGITDLAVADGGTGASNASDARSNLGLVIGTNVQAYSANLAAFSSKSAPSGDVVGTSDTQTLSGKTLTSPVLNTPSFAATTWYTNGASAADGTTNAVGFVSSGGVLSSRNSTLLRDHFVMFNPNGNLGAIYTDGSATFYSNTSDARLKKNVVPLAGSGGIIDALKPCSFQWSTGKDDTGFIAQEVHAVIPNAVRVGGDNALKNPWTVDTSRIIPFLVAEIQSLRARVKALE